MQVEWRRNPSRAMRLWRRLWRREEAAECVLQITLKERQALGMLRVAAPDGQIIARLMDCLLTAEKQFLLPEALKAQPFQILSNDGTVLFAQGMEAPPEETAAEAAQERTMTEDEA